ncbi:anti-sigma regulatory factor (Ser/Thr protein kinase) [Streptomyces griseochromogenes]|uniref:Anti-sigma regulatory factor (Ser/Thr protein kinase) n=1 Tax=Streptomyces griseochromogenes TaxID=68214 RepID=A0A1B1B1C0_9ACTN|nr:ATP-binding protein [Streptomyces griseochromogenes]ANP52551.1 response regulator receiver protein [Streptomyces griseochromogenes]MBP2047114.1 anti-sigma regulatory factor (Ser/Thr protein kinase) [Streptomyces griseochromogenes]
MAVQLNTPLREAYEDICPMLPVAGTVSTARRRARGLLVDWNVCPKIVEDSLLVVSELVTNAIVHALPPAVLRLSWVRCDGLGTLRVEVTDGGPALPGGHLGTGCDPDEHGRGEGIVHALADRHGIRIHGGGVTRWADLVTT